MTSAMLVEQRLEALPPKVSAPFKRLLETGQLNQAALSTILDAGELAGSPQTLLGFAVGYLYLRSNGVPVKDVIELAHDQGRRIRLDWSAKRWKLEHDRLSRAAALKRLSEDNVVYDLAKFYEFVPDDLPGYLIKTSRRLGMEGLRQRNCVASYHQWLLNGYSALAAVFHNKKRWTVQLGLTGDPHHPIRIQAIRTRLNGMPSAEETEAIYELFGVEFAPVRASTTGGARSRWPAAERRYMENLRLLLPVLRQHQTGDVVVSFDGSGDSGCVDGARFDNRDFDGNAVHVQSLSTASEFVDGQWVTTQIEEEKTVLNAIEALTDDYLEDTGVDWYNDDGGYGELTINVDEGIVSLEVNVRTMDSHVEWWTDNDIETGEKL